MRFALIAMTLAACGSDPSLEVVVTHPSSLTVETTTVTDYESTTMTCEDVEFSRLDAVQLEALEVTSETIGAGGEVTGSLEGMSRTNNKVIVARGYAGKKLVAIGCGSKGEVTGKEQLKITTFVAATASIKPPGMNLADGVAVTLSDAAGAPVDDKRPISWTVYGPAFSEAADSGNASVAVDDVKGGVWQPEKPTCASMNGLARVHPNPPMTVGGYAVQVRPAWSIELPPLYTSLTNADFTPLSLLGMPPATTRQYCAVHVFEDANHVKQPPLLACIDGATNVQQYKPAIANGKVTALAPMGSAATVPTGTISIISVPNGALRDVYAVNADGTVTALFGSTPATNGGIGCPGSSCDDALVVPPCGTTLGRLLLSDKATNNIRQFGARGGSGKQVAIPAGDAPGGVQLDNAGCVTQLAPGASSSLVQVATFHELTVVGAIGATKLMPCPAAGDCDATIAGDLTRGAGVGFTGGSEPHALFTSVDATGVVLVEVELGVSGGSVELSRVAAAGLPDRIVTGQLDKDTDVDVVWNMATRAQATTFEVAYSRDIGNTGQALEALSGISDLGVQSIQTADFDGNSFDDLVVLLGGKVAIIPMGVPVPVVKNADATCEP